MPAKSRGRIVGWLGLVMAALIFGTSLALAPEAEALGTTTAVTSVQGDVVVRHAGGDFVAARLADVLTAGDTLRTRGGSAEITYFEGSSVRLEPDTELVIQALQSRPDGGTVVTMWQAVGRTWHVVTKLITGSSRYEIHTPSSTASVRGTIFAVEVRLDADGPSATVTTSEGVVLHSAADSRTAVLVAAGQESTVARGAAETRAAPRSTLDGAPRRVPSHSKQAVPPAVTAMKDDVQPDLRTDPRAKPQGRSNARDTADRARGDSSTKTGSSGEGKR